MQPGAASVGELPARGEAAPARRRGARGSEDAGTSSEAGEGIPGAGCPRSPGEGSSSQGQSGPKARPKGVADQDGRQTFLHRAAAPRRRGDARDGSGRVLEAPVPRPPGGRGEARAHGPGAGGEATKRTRPRSAPGKAAKHAAARPYRRPTQVGRQRMPRRAGQPRPRNSAKPPRNLGRRGARESEPQRRGPSDCLPKTQGPAKPRGDV